ncbi:hypothetical protein BDL97_12G084500 [Sphagnum fallax]|nr:hypothetical protein BDL97_12G084500 [Sphagnum fallax]
MVVFSSLCRIMVITLDGCFGGGCCCFQSTSSSNCVVSQQKKPTGVVVAVAVVVSSLWVIPMKGLTREAKVVRYDGRAQGLVSSYRRGGELSAELWVGLGSRTRRLEELSRREKKGFGEQICKATNLEGQEELGETTTDMSLTELLRRDRSSDGRIQLEANLDPSVIAMLLLEQKRWERGEKQPKQRSLPIPMPHKLKRPLPLPRSRSRSRPLGFRNYHKKIASPSLTESSRFLSKLIATIKELPSQESVANVLELHKSRLQRRGSSLAEVILALGRDNNHIHRAVQVCEWMLQQQSFLLPDEPSLLGVLQVLIDTGALELASKLQALHHLSLLSTPKTVSKLGCLYAEAGYLKEAVHILLACGEMDNKLYVSVIVNAGRVGDKKLVRALLSRNQNASLQMEECTSVMAVCSKLGLEEEVESLFQHYKGLGFYPNVVIYTTVMSARSRAGKYREAVSLFWEMEETGCKPDLIAFQVMMGLCAKLKDVAKAAKLYNYMKDAGFSPTSDVYETLIQLYSEQGRMGKVKEVLKELEMRGCSPTINIPKCLSAAALKR